MEPLEILRQRPAVFDDWSEAYVKVENYLCALQVHNKLLLSSLVYKILTRAEKRHQNEPQRDPATLAAEEAQAFVHHWFASVIQKRLLPEDHLSVRGRLSLLLAEMPQKWQDQFLSERPWPQAFVEQMNESYIRSGPDFQRSRMTPRPIALGPLSTAADRTWKTFDRWPILGTLCLWLLILGLLGWIFTLTR